MSHDIKAKLGTSVADVVALVFGPAQVVYNVIIVPEVLVDVDKSNGAEEGEETDDGRI